MERQVLQHESPTPRILRRNRAVHRAVVPLRLRQPRQPGADRLARGNRNAHRDRNTHPDDYTNFNSYADSIPDRHASTYQHPEANPDANAKGAAYVFQLCGSRLV